ncbi:MAG: Asp-tRNA(Asn)/Glu-tRNA(Gln) amidotransferase subunit GatA [Desulfamplus sp.]|nr:Asp-tRNA(Asn)/Glu-tRNA(Gln) amidotransferase subunit GatA [Desulfamplus sp.]
MDLYELTIKQAQNGLAKRDFSSLDLVNAMLDRIEKLDGDIGAYITIDADGAREAAIEADQRIENGYYLLKNESFTDNKSNSNSSNYRYPLLGIPIALKDLLCTIGLKTTCASKILENFVPQYDATVVSMLKNAGAIIIGKTNLDEFAMGSSTENSGFHITRNPWDREHVPGGSSGGSAAAVSARMCIAALGTDTGGSIRQPASHCGVVGIKPTYGRVSRYGLVSYASSLDQIGPITKDVQDSAILLNVICGHDPLDSTSANVEVPDFTFALEQFKTDGLKGMKAGIPKEFLSLKGLDPDVENAFNKAKETLERLGVEMVEVSLPQTDYAVAAYYVIAPSEASSNLARFDGVRFGLRDNSANDLIDMYKKTKSKGFGAEVQRRIITGTYALSAGYYDAYYGRATRVRTMIRDDFTRAFEKCDIIISPVAPTPAFKIGENIDDPLTMYLTDIFTLSTNMAGLPGISVPCGFSSKGLPIGLQIMANHFDEMALIKAGYGLEQTLDIKEKFPII